MLAASAVACNGFAAADADTLEATAAPSLTPVPSATAPAELEGCTGTTGTGPAIVDLLRRADGSCVPTDVAVIYRCAPSLDPVAVLGFDGDRYRFLGGRFAVPLPRLPEGARPLGIGVFGRVWTMPDPGWFLVETPTGVERWMALPEPEDVADPPTVTLIGDSILDGAAASLGERLPGWTLAIDAEIGRSSGEGAATAEALVVTGDLVVIELGVNDVDADATVGYADRIVMASTPAGGLIWVNAHGPEPHTDAVNEAIEAALGRAPDTALADWDDAAPTSAFSSDGVHLLDASGAAFVAFLAPLLEAWHETAVGRGADACGARIVAGG